MTDWSQQKTLIGHANVINTLAFTADGKTLASGSWDRTIRLWDPILGLERIALRTPQVNSIVFSADSTRMISGHNDQSVRIYRAATESDVLSRDSKSPR